MSRFKLRPPWYFCCGWWAPWCFIDQTAHILRLPHWSYQWICDRHDRAITGDDE